MRHVVLLRGINLGPSRRVSMAELRELLFGAGFEDVATYVQSGNVVLSSRSGARAIASQCERLIEERFGFEVPVIVRSHAELEAVVERDPLGKVASDPKRYQVTFLANELDAAKERELAELAAGGEQLIAAGREIYAWHPDGVGRSKLAARLAGKDLGTVATARNWKTVTKLLEMATER